jgi:hypothetical protein
MRILSIQELSFIWAAREAGAKVNEPIFVSQLLQQMNQPIESAKLGDTFVLKPEDVLSFHLIDLDERSVLPN